MGLPGYSHFLVVMGRLDEAIAMARKILSVQPNNVVAQSALAGSLFMKGMYDDLIDISIEERVKDPELREELKRGYSDNGFAWAQKRLNDILEARYGKPGGPRAIILSLYYARAGDKESVIQWLNKACEEHGNNMAYIGADPIFDLARDDPRFQNLVRRMGLPPIVPD